MKRLFIIRHMVLMCFVLGGLSKAAFAEEGIPLHGFADVGWGAGGSSQPVRERTRGFQVGTVDLYLTPQFQDNVKALAEIVLEPGLDTDAYSIDVERIQVGYTFGDSLTVWAGRFHTPYGYWNTAYHHGAQIQPSVYKPRFVDWEDHAGFLPSHSTGLWLTGKTGAGSGKVNYDVFVANGSRNVSGAIDMNQIRDDNDNPAVGTRVSYKFGGGLDGLVLGVHGLTEEVGVYDNNKVFFRKSQLNMYGGFAVFENDHVELSSEVYLFADPNPNVAGSPTYTSAAGFLHLGVYVTPDNVIYTRYERTKINQDDPYFNSHINGFSYHRGLIGVRHNLNARACIKLEANRTSIEDTMTYANANLGAANPTNQGTYTEMRAQYAISF